MKSAFRGFGFALGAMLWVGVTGSTARAQPNAEAAPPAASPDAEPVPMPPPPAPPPPPPEPMVAPMAMMPPPPSPPSQLKLELPNGTSIRFGLLVQPAYQVAGSVQADGYSENIFIRRTRILIGGSIMGAFDYFFDTDFPNIGLATPVAANMTTMAPASTAKVTPGLNVQDIFVTWKSLGDGFKIDVGYMLPPFSHNSVQGATTLFGWDYFAASFLHTAGATSGFGQNALSPVGRDTGVQLRGLVAGGMLEYRVGAFQGIRRVADGSDPTSSNLPRFVARLQLNLMDADPGFFYAGTYLGKKKMVSIGASYDYQKNPVAGTNFDDSYHTFDVDAFVDLPIGPAGVLTVQDDFIGWHGGTMIGGLPKWTEALEAGFTFSGVMVSPIARYERAWGGTVPAAMGATADFPTTSRYALGLAYWPYGHNVNLKLFGTRIQTEGAPHGANQVNLQLQIFYF